MRAFETSDHPGPWVIVNPGVQPELQRLSERLHAEDRLRVYITSFSVGMDWQLAKPLAAILSRLAPRTIRDIERRRLNIPDEQIIRSGLLFEVAFMLLLRTSSLPSLREWLLDARDITVQKRASRFIQNVDPPVVVLGRSTSSLQVFRAAKKLGLTTILDYPIAHHNWANEQLDEAALRRTAAEKLITEDRVPDAECTRLTNELRLADHILCLTDFHAATFESQGIPSERLLLHRVGVDLSLFGPSSIRRKENTFRVIFCGQMVPRKGILDLFEAWDLADLEHAELLLVGSDKFGLGASYSRRHANVKVLGHVARQDLPAIYATCDAFVLPSLIEGMAQTPLEAMASGLAVITTPNAVGNYLITHGENGVLVDAFDVDSLAKSLRRLQRQPDFLAYISRNAAQTAQSYAW